MKIVLWITLFLLASTTIIFSQTVQQNNLTSQSLTKHGTIANDANLFQLLQIDLLISKTEDCDRDTTFFYYQAMLGVIYELWQYKKRLAAKKEAIDLFPTAYYYTTFNEVDRIRKGYFQYPIDKMKQMVAFYDAYHWNRVNWNYGKPNDHVENHWKIHFEKCQSSWFSWCVPLPFVLESGAQAHVAHDLPRAIRYAYNSSYRQVQTFSEYRMLMEEDFHRTDDLFPKTTASVLSFISENYFCNETILKTSAKIVEHLTQIERGVVKNRHAAWNLALSHKLNTSFKQPPTRLNYLNKYGQVFLPKKKGNNNAKLLTGSALIFRQVNEYDLRRAAKVPLSISQKNHIFQQLNLKISKNGQGFYEDDECGREWKDSWEVFTINLNSDQKPELIIHYNNYCYIGNAESQLYLFVKNKDNCNYELKFTDIGTYYPQQTSSNGFKDFILAGPGMQRPLVKWNGREYKIARWVNFD